MTMQRKILTFILAALFALSAFAASAEAYYYHEPSRFYESYDRTYEYNVNENSDHTTSYDSCRYCRGHTTSSSYSRSENFRESIRHDTYERSPRYSSYYNPHYGSSRYRGSSYRDHRYNDYSPLRSRARYPSSYRAHYDPFGYYRARPHRQYAY